jgi:arginine decarboxylase
LVQLNKQTYTSFLQERYNRASEGPLTDFLTRRNGCLYLGNRVNLNDLARRYGTPLEVVYYPQITRQVKQMQAWANQARRKTGYTGSFLYAYATKANFAADVVQTALDAGAHYETSAATDVEIARYLWRQGILPRDRLIFCNGSKDITYTRAIRTLREDGCTSVVPIIDDLDELAELRTCPDPLKFGVRERAAGNRDGTHPGNDRFGLTSAEIDQVAADLQESQHQLVLYHAMIGSQVEDREHFLAMLRESVAAYCRLRQQVPSLRYFNFGGGTPTSGYSLDFDFDYVEFLRELMEQIREVCAAYAVPLPDLIGEFGRYTVANHSVFLFEVGKVKSGQHGAPAWYMINGSLMVSMPDTVLVDNQQFVILPLDNWDAPVRPVRLAGRQTCDSDDIYPRPAQEPLLLPDTGSGLVLAVCGVGAYQQMISGRGGAHHCLTPEPRRIAIGEQDGRLLLESKPQQERAAIMRQLGYRPQRVAPPLRMVPRPATRKAALTNP